MTDPMFHRCLLAIGLGALILVPAGLAAWLKDGSLVWPVALSCMAAVLLIRLPDVELFKVGPMEARLRQTTREAEATIEQIQKLGATLARPVLNSYLNAGKLGGISNQSKIEAYEGIEKSLRSLGIKQDQLDQALYPFKYFAREQVFWKIRGHVVGGDVVGPILDKTRTCFNGGPLKPASDLKACLSAVIAIDNELDELIKDLDQAQKSGTLRRREEYFNGSITDDPLL